MEKVVLQVALEWTRRRFLEVAGYTVAGAALAACGAKSTAPASGGGSSPAPAGGASNPIPKLDDTLRIDMYGDKAQDIFIDTIAKPFGEKYGVKIVTGSYSSQTQMLAQVKSAPGEYDIVRCSDLAIYDGVSQGLLEAFDMGNIPNWKNLDSKVQKPPSDPGDGVHTLSFQPGCYLYIKVNDKVPGNFDSYAPFYDPKYAGKISLRDYGGYRVLQTALHLGFDFNHMTADQEKKVFDTLREQRKLVKTYWKNEAEVRSLIANRDVWLADYWVDATIKNSKELNFSWWIPKQGTPGWMEGLSIAKGSKHKRTAEALFNYFLVPENFMRFAKAASTIPTLRSDLWNEEQHKKDVPDLAPFMTVIRERTVQLNLTTWTRKNKEWTEAYEQIKLGA